MRTDRLTATILAVLLGIAGLPLTAYAQQAPRMRTVTLQVPDMFCGGCEVAVRIAARKVDGVTDVRTSSEKRTADVTYDTSRTTAAAIASAITKNSGFKVQIPKANASRPPS